jgi:hypothetical protein
MARIETAFTSGSKHPLAFTALHPVSTACVVTSGDWLEYPDSFHHPSQNSKHYLSLRYFPRVRLVTPIKGPVTLLIRGNTNGMYCVCRGCSWLELTALWPARNEDYDKLMSDGTSIAVPAAFIQTLWYRLTPFYILVLFHNPKFNFLP